MKINEFLFDSSWQLITWVCIGLSGAFFVGYFFKGQGRGMMWAGISLGVFILLMLGMVADRVFFRDRAIPSEIKERPYVTIKEVQLDGVTVGASPIVLIAVENGPVETTLTFKNISYVFTTFVPEKYLKYRQDTSPQTFSLAPHQPLTVRWRWGELIFTEDQIKALNDKPTSAELYFFARGTYSDKYGSHPLPVCWRYDKDFPNHLALCADDIKIE